MMTFAKAPVQNGILSKQQFAGTIAALQLILLLAAVDQTIIATAMPRIVAELGGFGRYAWATTSYLLTSTIAVPVSGRLSDIYGRKKTLLIGIATFVFASLMCGCAGASLGFDGMTQLVAARAFQGVGGGVMLALIFAVIADILPPAERGKYQGHFAAVFALASIFGPVLGGWAVDWLSWRWLFLVNIPVGLLAMFVFAKSFPSIAPHGSVAPNTFGANNSSRSNNAFPANNSFARNDSSAQNSLRRTNEIAANTRFAQEAPNTNLSQDASFTANTNLVPNTNENSVRGTNETLAANTNLSQDASSGANTNLAPDTNENSLRGTNERLAPNTNPAQNASFGTKTNRVLDTNRAAPVRTIDYTGIITFSLALSALLCGLGWIADFGVSSWQVIVSLSIACIAGAVFIPIELRAKEPLMPLALFVQPIVAISSVSLFVTGVGMFGSVLLIPLFLQLVKSLTPATSGALLTPLILVVAGASVVGGLVMSRQKKYKILVLVALTLMTAGVLPLCTINDTSPVSFVIGCMMLSGTGLGLLLPVYPIVIQNAVPQDKVGTVTGFSQFFRSIGGTVGVALLGSLMLAYYRTALAMQLPHDLPERAIALLNNPLEPAKMKAQLALVVPPAVCESLLEQVRNALVSSMDQIFVLYAIALSATLLLSLWLEERPLREVIESDVHSETV